MAYVTVADLAKIEKLMNKEWYHKLFKTKQAKQILLPIITALEKYPADSLYPNIVNAFEAFNYASPRDIKAVIFSTSPCETKSTGSGLAYGSKVTKLNKLPSLTLIDRCLKQTCSVTITDPSLVSLANQGVLLINLAMCSRLGKESEMLELWCPFIERVITILFTDVNTQLSTDTYAAFPAFFLWGATIISRVEPILIKLMTELTIAPTDMKIYAYAGTPFVDPNSRNPVEFSKCMNFSEYNKAICMLAEYSRDRVELPYTTNPAACINIDRAAEYESLQQSVYNRIMSRIIKWGTDYIIEDLRVYDNIIFTDGSANNKQAKVDAGYGIYFSKGFLENRCIAGNMKYTNTKLASGGAELKAVLEALILINSAIDLCKSSLAAAITKTQESAPTPVDVFVNNNAINQETGEVLTKDRFAEDSKTDKARVIIILSDSEYAINTVNVWADNWVRESRLEKMCNSDIVRDILINKAKLKESGYLVRLCHAKGHGKEPTSKDTLEYFKWYGNKVVDALANIGRAKETYYDTPASVPM